MSIINYTDTKFEKGQNVVLRWCGNKAISSDGYSEGVVEKVGRKYLYIRANEYSVVQIDISTGYQKTEYTPNYKLYPSIAHLKNEMERESILNKLYKIFGNYSKPDISLIGLQEIMRIIEEDNL